MSKLKAIPDKLPVHFFTIVLNGMPFIKYHLDVFKRLPFRWHWHIIEGVAAHRHDTSWCLAGGGRIDGDMHDNGLSLDGTSEYIEEIYSRFPNQVIVYRKKRGEFFDGKQEMVNAPLRYITEESLLWEIDADELWTPEQLIKCREMFLSRPDKTAAYFWSWFFTGENLVVSTRNCYSQNPNQEWLRVWRYRPGCVWAAHEPPILAEPAGDGKWRNVAQVNPFSHAETEAEGLVFQHHAYVTEEQLKFKERYYGYAGAVRSWRRLQLAESFPARLGDYFPWVTDHTQVQLASAFGVRPLIMKSWDTVKPEGPKGRVKIVVDAMFYQIFQTGIARVWKSLFEEWGRSGFAENIVVLDRKGTAPKFDGVNYLLTPEYNYARTDIDREILQKICDEEEADLFISTYYTTPLSTPAAVLLYDMMPEIFGYDMTAPMWREKHFGIRYASYFSSISESTVRDLKKFFPDLSDVRAKVVHLGVGRKLRPCPETEIDAFRKKYGIRKPYFLVVGLRIGYKNTKLFFAAFSCLADRKDYCLVLTGTAPELEDQFKPYVQGVDVHHLWLEDDEMRAAYAGATALAFPSEHEGFGMPIIEAMACGCPVITCRNSSIPEVAGDAVIYVKTDDVEMMRRALEEVRRKEVREPLIRAGYEQAAKFDWSNTAKVMGDFLVESALEARRERKAILDTSISTGAAAMQPAPDYLRKRWKVRGAGGVAAANASQPVQDSRAQDAQPPLRTERPPVQVESAASPASPAQASSLPDDVFRKERYALARTWLDSAPSTLPALFSGEAGKKHGQLMRDMGMYLPLASDERLFCDDLLRTYKKKGAKSDKGTAALLALSLYLPAFKLPEDFRIGNYPGWLKGFLYDYWFLAPEYFSDARDFEKYLRYVKKANTFLHDGLVAKPDNEILWETAFAFINRARFLHLYFSELSLKGFYVQRGRMTRIVLGRAGYPVENASRPEISGRTRIRLGVLLKGYADHSESLAVIPAFEHLDKSEFEVIAFAFGRMHNHVEEYVSSIADEFVVLPPRMEDRIGALRGYDLDALFFGSNTTLCTNEVFTLACLRLARVQFAHYCNPVTTGLETMDCFLVGSLMNFDKNAVEEFSENVAVLEGSGICFSKHLKRLPPSENKFTRAALNVPDKAVLFASGANCHKIVPDLRRLWVRILSAVPDSCLLLYPFGPNWGLTYPARAFLEGMLMLTDQARIARERLVILNTLPSEADIVSVLGLADVYLDAVPYSGATSLLEPLEAGLPPVVYEGRSLRSKQGAAMLREVGISEVIADSQDKYVRLATELAMNPEMRARIRGRIAQAMSKGAPFLDSRHYSAQVGAALKKMLKG